MNKTNTLTLHSGVVQHMATGDGKKNIMSGCRAANIQDGSDAQNLDVVCALLRDEIAVRSVGYSRDENQNVSDSDEKWESNRGTFEAIQEMQDEFDDKGGIIYGNLLFMQAHIYIYNT